MFIIEISDEYNCTDREEFDDLSDALERIVRQVKAGVSTDDIKLYQELMLDIEVIANVK